MSPRALLKIATVLSILSPAAALGDQRSRSGLPSAPEPGKPFQVAEQLGMKKGSKQVKPAVAEAPRASRKPAAKKVIRVVPAAPVVAATACDPILTTDAASTVVQTTEAAEESYAGATYILDTNILMSNPGAIFGYAGARVVIPGQVLQELDQNNHGTKVDASTRANIRRANRLLVTLA
ncbi:MAG: PIN domain-containing protein [Bdellovibrionales bacterium]